MKTQAISGPAFSALLLVALLMGSNHIAARIAFDNGADVAAAVVMRISRAAALRLPAMVKVEKKPRSAAWRRGSIVDLRLTVD